MLRELPQTHSQREVFERTLSKVKGRWALLHSATLTYAATWPPSRCLLRRALLQSLSNALIQIQWRNINYCGVFDDGLLGPHTNGCGDEFVAA